MKKILLVDLSSIFWQNWHATKDQETGNAFDGTIAKINRHWHDYDHVGICVDSPPYKRKEIYPEYKAQRDKPSEVAVGQLERTIRRLKADGLPIFKMDGYEADDVIASIVKKVNYAEIDILTGDKDLAQCIEVEDEATDIGAVSIISTQTGAILDPPGVYEKFGVKPELMCDFLALCGDKSDNVPGVPGVGPKRAVQLLNQFGGVSELVQACQGGKLGEDLLPKIRETLLDPQTIANLLTAHALVKLNDGLDIDIAPLFAPNVPTGEVEPEPIEVIDSGESLPPVKPAESIVKAQPAAVAPVEYSKALEPSTADGAWRLARVMLESRLYSHLQSREAIMAVMLRGRALGLDATTSLDAFHVIQGKPTMSADLVVALVLRSPVCRYFKLVESTDDHATYKTLRVDDPDGEPVVHTYTRDQAEQLGITNKDNWRKQPATMLRHRCSSALARIVYPDIVMGLYDPDEF